MIFVTGGTGLVGAHLIYELLVSGNKVRALRRKTSNLNLVLKIFSYYNANAQQLFDKIEWVNGDILDYFSIENILSEVESVYHCAAIVSFDPKERKKMIANNVEGTANLVNASLQNKVKKFCHVSSIAALGRLLNGFPVNEETKWVPSKKNSAYSESKFYSEMEIWRGIEEGLNAVIVNPSIILGPGDWETGSPKLFNTVWKGLKFYTKGVTGFVDVKDVVKASILLMDNSNFEDCKNQRYLLNAENISYKEIFNQIAEGLGKPSPKYFASNFMLGIAWRFAAVANFIRSKASTITRDAVASSNVKNYFDGGKITEKFDFGYKNISESIQETAQFFISDHNK